MFHYFFYSPWNDIFVFFRAYHGIALFGCKLYIIGGFDGYSVLSTNICLNLRSRRKSRMSPLSMPRCYVLTLTYRGYVYAFGGHNGENRLKSCEVFDPRRNTWIGISDMLFRRSDASGCELKGKSIYIYKQAIKKKSFTLNGKAITKQFLKIK